MNLLDLFVRSYGWLQNYPKIPFWVLAPLRYLERWGARAFLPRYLSKPKVWSGKQQNGLIVSFTSFPTRINTVWQVVECMLRQTCRPEKILLWLSKEQFPTPESIPQSLRERESELFEIRMVEGDIRSHKKYYYVSKEYPDSLIFLIDDDIYYDTHLIERVVEAHEKWPEALICNYGHHIGWTKAGCLKPYNQWQHEYRASVADDLFFGSGGGTLFRPSELHEDLVDIEKARSLCPIADDVWLNVMARLAGKKIVLLKNGEILPVYTPDNVVLWQQNQGEFQNDKQLMAVKDYYGLTSFHFER